MKGQTEKSKDKKKGKRKRDTLLPTRNFSTQTNPKEVKLNENEPEALRGRISAPAAP